MSISILIADESAAARENLMSAMPSEWDVTFSEATNSNDALAACHRGQGAVLFLDTTLPGMSNSDLMDLLERTNANTSVIIVSGDARASLRGEARAHGAVAFVEKPVRADALASVLRACNLFSDDLLETEAAY
jgi:DNA-binding NtrC family response regulator